MEPDFGYTGLFVHHRSGLNLTVNRSYSSSLGRWLSRDFGKTTTASYAYVGNNPVSYVDTFGLTGTMTRPNTMKTTSITNSIKPGMPGYGFGVAFGFFYEAMMEWIDAQVQFHGGQDCAKNYGDDQAKCKKERDEREEHCHTDMDYEKSDEKFYKCLEKAHKKFKNCMKSKGYDFDSMENLLKMHDQQRQSENDPELEKIKQWQEKQK